VSWTTLTGAGGIVVHDGRLLMIRQRRSYGVYWEFPSGYYEPGESFEQATEREVLEETAIAVEVGELVCTMVWEREHDRRRNLLAYFLATPLDPAAEPRAQARRTLRTRRSSTRASSTSLRSTRSTKRSSSVGGRPGRPAFMFTRTCWCARTARSRTSSADDPKAARRAPGRDQPRVLRVAYDGRQITSNL
jgi:ADP-ribose pyrophosphatase YjhB (NUDIX family)